MSVFATVQHPLLLFKALSAVKLHKDCWATVIFTDTAVVLHVEGSDQCTTATAMLPKKLFSVYSVTDARMEVHLQTLMDALTLVGGVALATNAVTVQLMYPSADGRLVVELSSSSSDNPMNAGLGGGIGFPGGRGSTATVGSLAVGQTAAGSRRVLHSRIMTRPVKDNLLDLHFRDNVLVAQATLHGDALRDAISDLLVAQCAETTLTLSPKAMSVQLRGAGSPFGTADITVKKSSEALLSLEGVQPLATGPTTAADARTKVSTRHLAVACGLRATGSGAGGSRSRLLAGGFGSDMFGAGGVFGGALAGGGAGGGGGAGFERLTLQVNAQQQLSVVHMQRDHDVKVTVTVVVNPLFDYDLTS